MGSAPPGGVGLDQFLDDALASALCSTAMAARGVRPTSLPGQHWVQTWPDKIWNVILRRYSPLDHGFDETQSPGEIAKTE